MRHPISGLWNPATVMNTTNNPRNYIIQCDNDAIVRRNRLHPSHRAPLDNKIQRDKDINTRNNSTSQAKYEDVLPRTGYGRVIKPDPRHVNLINNMCY